MTSAFFSYHFDDDAARASAARRVMAIEADDPINPTAWEDLGYGGDTAITRWVIERMRSKECLIVLIGSQTASRKWVNYEIKQAWESGRGVMGINIHSLHDARGNTSAPGKNPFDDFIYDGQHLSDLVRVYEPLGDTPQENLIYIANNVQGWALNAVNSRKTVAA